MKTKSSFLLKCLCTAMFLILTLAALLCAIGLAAGIGYDVSDPENARQQMFHSIEDPEYSRICNVLTSHSVTDESAYAVRELARGYDPARSNLRIRITEIGGTTLFDTLTDANALYPNVYPYAKKTEIPLPAEKAGFSENDTNEILCDRFFTLGSAVTYREQLLNEAQSVRSILLYKVEPDGSVISLDLSAFPGPEQTGHEMAVPTPVAPSGQTLDAIGTTDSGQIPEAFPYNTEATLSEAESQNADSDLPVYLMITKLPGAIGSNAVCRSFSSFSDANAFRTQLAVDYPGTDLSVETIPELGLWIVHAHLIQTTSSEYEIAIGIDRSLPVHDLTALLVHAAEFVISRQPVLGWGFALSFLGAIACLVWLCIAKGHKRGVEGIHLTWFDRIPFDLLLIMLLILLAGSYYLVSRLSDQIYDVFPWNQATFLNGFRIAVFLMLLILWILLALWTLLSFVGRIKAGRWWENTVVFRLLRWIWHGIRILFGGIRQLIINLPLYWRTALIWGGLSLIILLALMLYGRAPLLWLWLAAELILTPLVWYTAICLRRLEKGGEELAKGNLNYHVSVSRMLPAFRRHAEHLNSITDGMQRAVREQMKSERMKTELITNVSHDIKTPLTSIINYIKLLERDGLQSEHAPEYLEVLDRQSARLKKLTDDLVEASKASSGAISVTLERTDLHVLIEQVLGEYAEKLRSAQLSPVITLCESTPFVLADGKLLWRVFDNLFGNLCKYALPGTRVYLQTALQGVSAVVTLKNVSRDPLNISGEELMERFVRGDSSRNTEGSGLGLSISQSLIALQNGIISIDIDGDLFKVTLTLPVTN